MRTLFAYLAILGSAAFAGTMLCIGFAFGSYWTSLEPQAFLDWFATNNGFVARSIPIVALPAAIGLLGSLWLAICDARARSLRITAVACMVGVWIVTVAYHFPANAAFANGSVPVGEVASTLRTWLALHALRIALALAAAAIALRATTKSYEGLVMVDQ